MARVETEEDDQHVCSSKRYLNDRERLTLKRLWSAQRFRINVMTLRP